MTYNHQARDHQGSTQDLPDGMQSPPADSPSSDYGSLSVFGRNLTRKTDENPFAKYVLRFGLVYGYHISDIGLGSETKFIVRRHVGRGLDRIDGALWEVTRHSFRAESEGMGDAPYMRMRNTTPPVSRWNSVPRRRNMIRLKTDGSLVDF